MGTDSGTFLITGLKSLMAIHCSVSRRFFSTKKNISTQVKTSERYFIMGVGMVEFNNRLISLIQDFKREEQMFMMVCLDVESNSAHIDEDIKSCIKINFLSLDHEWRGWRYAITSLRKSYTRSNTPNSTLRRIILKIIFSSSIPFLRKNLEGGKRVLDAFEITKCKSTAASLASPPFFLTFFHLDEEIFFSKFSIPTISLAASNSSSWSQLQATSSFVSSSLVSSSLISSS